jgi:hypothetical protein
MAMAVSEPEQADLTAVDNEEKNDVVVISLPAAPEQTADGLTETIIDQYPAQPQVVDERTDIQQSVERANAVLTENFQITLTEKQSQRASKLVNRWMEKKQDPSSVDWAPRTNMEMFSLGAAGVGLVVAFFSPIGWFVFLVAALAYLYLKLLKN